ncbi:pentapeptide repeat-containing protein [Fluviispira multicolorata]|uniref:Pentapeptide repeat protein n=1 Tax=Fluviispira multicolorata TaxID=2654512 RepID=A0A833N7J4_9BACT|nr:pentapeptide repeat-containing protein [Fluviispira multicolorata]KAB8032230.1 hypothetical protein GCL57_06170 [Fluviispira multicolorata]
MLDLNSILDSVANGNMNVEKAKSLIEKNYVLKKQKKGFSEEFQNAKEESQEGLKSAFEKLKKTVNIEELIKISSNLVSQISENMPQIEKIQENIAHNLQPIGFSPNISGLESKLSVFRAFHSGTDCLIKNNLVVGSQWFGVNISENSEVKNNKFTAVQFSELAIIRTDFCTSQFSLARLSNVTMQEARLENNKFSRTSISDVCIKESDFTENLVVKSDFTETTITGSRLSRLNFHTVDFQDCEIDTCDLQGIDFENCKFKECIFSNLEIIMDEPLKVNGRNIVGRNFSDCKNAEEFLYLLDSTSNDSHN